AIEMCGYSDIRAGYLKRSLIGAFKEAGLETVAVTIESCTDIRYRCGSLRPAPHLRVYATSADELERLVCALKRCAVSEALESFHCEGIIPAGEMVGKTPADRREASDV
ncbi:MAG TPA: hypothetical protein VMC43_02050, partial [Candidatus Paceibacterota bacterium]|nr:hypothetical protein [Candidatus Paceibacterota bacterium]